MKTENKLPRYWTKIEDDLLKGAKTFSELTVIAKIILKRMQKEKKPIMQVCGPIATGGHGSIEENLKEFEKAIIFLRSTGLVIFDQMPFEGPMQKIKKTMSMGEAHKQIMDDFYLPLMQEGYIARYFFLHNWETSKGSKIEYERAPKYGIAVEVLPELYKKYFYA